ncbi:MAG TPA: class I SAM-dependent methyltransferase, partial [Acetobacteraceae bacterium]|nr:class I SAM-dependent methyltransferase [Acetobacteraceae bacterium]
MDWIDYDQHARTRDREDFWGQVRRTVRGQAVGPEQIEMIVSAVMRHLELAPEDHVLDLACGNGALTALLQPFCASTLGVDISPYLIGIAREHFASARHRFLEQDAAEYAETEPDPTRFTKALCYGSLSYLDD